MTPGLGYLQEPLGRRTKWESPASSCPAGVPVEPTDKPAAVHHFTLWGANTIQTKKPMKHYHFLIKKAQYFR
jgi:hypothetical protein